VKDPEVAKIERAGELPRSSVLVGNTMRLRFADCVFDSDTREILRAGKPVHVSPKAFALLAALIERRPKAISKDDLHALLWPDTFVSEANLPNLVAELRETLGDDAQNPRLIRTVPRFGYAFRAKAAGESSRTVLPAAFRLIWGDREIALSHGENVIGRDEAAALWIDDNLVSRRHARIVIDGAAAFLEDLGSKNGTVLGNRRIESPTRLADEDLITIGPASMIFRVLSETGSTRSASRKPTTARPGGRGRR
jgi:DNA-binding winged helix-turn-helix (wHTH) protein